MKKFFTNRNILFGILIMAFCCVLIGQLVNLQIVGAEENAASADKKKEKTLSVRGERGKILDRNMVPLAYDEDSYNIEFYRDPNKNTSANRAEYTRILRDAIYIIETNGFTTLDTFYIVKDETGTIRFDWRTEDEEAQKVREKQWRGNFYLRAAENDTRSPQEIYDYLLGYFGIPTDISFDEQRKVLSIWQEAQATIYLSTPINIAENVDLQTVCEIAARAMELPDISVAQSTMRVYPQNETAAHIVGYIGAMPDDETVTQYKERGYSPADKIGVAGIEKTMEDQLSANVSYRQGSRRVEINNLGRVMRELDYKEPINGNSVVLTIDLELQRFTEESLKNNIDRTREKEITEKLENEKWQKDNEKALESYEKDEKEISLANTGAAIVMDVNNGNVLSMVSYPSYDPNAFVQGDLDTINSYLEKDAHEPLFNRAISTKDIPGSIFKMATALAALMEGVVTPSDRIEDETRYKKYLDDDSKASLANAPTCWSKNKPHGHQNVVDALQNSCNYYFFEVTSRMGIETLYKWSSKLGLGSRTGIELPMEARGVIAHNLSLYDPDKSLTQQDTYKPAIAAREIRKILVEASEKKGMEYDEDRLNTLIDALMDLAASDKNIKDLNPDIREILLDYSGLSMPEISSQALVSKIRELLRDVKWTGNESMWAAIGQSIHQHTPIAVARYISAIVNGGTVYEAQLVDKIVDANGDLVTDKQPVVVTKLEGAEEYLEVIKSGMKNVVSTTDEGRSGTAQKIFEGFAYLDEIGGKTGTAEKSDLDVENNAWFVAFAPYEKPEIAVVVYIASGLAGSESGWCARDILEYWLEQNGYTDNEIPSYGVLIP